VGFVISFFLFSFFFWGKIFVLTLTEKLKNIGVNSPNFAPFFLRGKVYQIEKKIPGCKL